MHKFVRMLMGVVALGAVTVVRAVDLEPLSVQEMARYGATHMLEITPEDLAATTTENAAQTNTVTLTGPLSWEFRGFVCDRPFNDAKAFATNGKATTTNSIAVTVTLGSKTLVNGVQVAGDQFRTYRSWLPNDLTVTTTGPATNQLVSTGSTPYVGVVTNGATETLTWITGAPGAGASLGNLTRGKARVFLRIVD